MLIRHHIGSSFIRELEGLAGSARQDVTEKFIFESQ
jgi:hypothetical protein